MGRAKKQIEEKKLRSWKLLDDFRSRLAKIRAEMPPQPERRPGGPGRLLLEEDYFSLMLFGMLNPVLDTMRGLCAASHLERVQDEDCGRKVSLGSFSEAQGVFDPELLKGVFLDLAAESQTSWGDPRMEIVKELAVSEADLAAGVTWQAKVELGDQWQEEPIRVVRVEVDGKPLLLATDLEIEAELIALIYRYRWQIELFFKWLKSILGCRHLLAESSEGVAIQIYSALIAALMLQAFTGKRPGKRAMELIQMYLMGYVDLNEMIALLGVEKIAK